MQYSDIPDRFNIPFADAAGGAYINPIPEASQIGIHDGYASLTDGFVPDNAIPRASGGVPPRIKDFNGLLKQMTLWNRWQGAGFPVRFDGTFSTAIGGYPMGAMLASATPGLFWVSAIDDNTGDPGSDDTNWFPWPAYGMYAPGAELDADYTFILTDAGRQFYHAAANARTWTIPNNATVAFPAGATMRVINDTGAGNIVIAPTAPMLLRWFQGGLSGGRTIAPGGYADLTHYSTNQFLISGFGIT